MSVHNAVAGLFSMTYADQRGTVSIAVGESTVENAIIETCGLLWEGAEEVLLLVYDVALPRVFSHFHGGTVPFSWAWLVRKPTTDILTLSWSGKRRTQCSEISDTLSPELEVFRFFLSGKPELMRVTGRSEWRWHRRT
jgi:hypothetical protein